ncbi:hypothetical protein [Pseudomonas abietaniphila]|uniref:hypothetical protein n=1 Tax=Pseudomonas abietaniphila TaxID=89065 RepID=UPI00078393A2|nr:hypothetical protein [Pseudomonas abietaniphila]
MNGDNLHAAALKLETELNAYAVIDPEAAELYADLKPLLKLVLQGVITTPWEWGQIPGRYRFSEQGLQKYEKLEQAFATFCIELTGGETPTLKWMREFRSQNN